MALLHPATPFYHLKKQKKKRERKERRGLGERPFRVLRVSLNRIRIGVNSSMLHGGPMGCEMARRGWVGKTMVRLAICGASGARRH